ncbi:MAG: glutamate-5-semialdehyde dehydrogenase [Lachnospiraceae bacterium]|nr:glutamate-5-semialdehyde dehydrogenase [Lachnospiraceae bacterium]
MDMQKKAHEMKLVSPKMAAASGDLRNAALSRIAKTLQDNKEAIFAENQKDLSAAKENGISEAVYKRLKFDEGKLKAVVEGLEQLTSLPDPVGKEQMHRQLDEGLILHRVSCPIGVIGVIFEARPDAMVQISSLCIKSGNCAILKGGKETVNTNRILFSLIEKSCLEAGLPAGCLLQAQAHAEIDELLSCEKDVDLLIPRGSNAFVSYIMNHTKIPVMGHADGICHIYIDRAADLKKAIPIVIDAKTQYTAACNAVETLLVHEAIAEEFLPAAAKALHEAGVYLRGDEASLRDMKKADLSEGLDPSPMSEEDYSTEYLELKLSVKVVRDLEEAVDHINRFGSHHTDAIITEDEAAAGYFMQMVDSAGVYQNASTRFADGFRYGFGAEVGISTGKIHARGPVGLEGLMTYKYKLYGEGQIVGDYADGKRSFHFKDL